MEIVSHLAGALAQSAAVARQQSADKAAQVRRAQALRKDVAAAGDTFEPHVESAEELSAVHDDRQPPRDGGRRNPRPKPVAPKPDGDGTPHIDVTA